MVSAASEAILIENRLSELARVERWLSSLLERWAVPFSCVFAVDLVVNEAVTNVISYAFPDDGVHEIGITLTDCTDRILVEIEDDGMAFDPFATPAAAMPGDLDAASIGARGILLIKSFSESYHYSRVAGRNRLAAAVLKNDGASATGS